MIIFNIANFLTVIPYLMNLILKNIQQIAINEGISINKLEQIIGASKGVLSRAIAKNTDIQAKWVVKIAENYPQYNCEWLIKSEGEMIKPVKGLLLIKEDTQETAINYRDLSESRKETIDSMKREIMHLEEKIEILKNQNNLQ